MAEEIFVVRLPEAWTASDGDVPVYDAAQNLFVPEAQTGGGTGEDGRTILNGSGAPASGLGVDGDFYIDTVADAIYGPKAAGAWGSATSLIGPAGPTGPEGPAGDIGTYTSSESDAIARAVQDRLTERVSVKDFGALGVGASYLGSITATSTTLTLKTDNEDIKVGHRLSITGAGVAGAALIATVSAVVNSRTLTLATAASTTVTDQVVVHRTTIDTVAAAGATSVHVNQKWTWQPGHGIHIPGAGQAATYAVFEVTVLTGSDADGGTITIPLDDEHIGVTATATVGNSVTAANAAIQIETAIQNLITANTLEYTVTRPGSSTLIRLTATSPGPRNKPSIDVGTSGVTTDATVNGTKSEWAQITAGQHAKDYFGEIVSVTPDTGAASSPATLVITPALVQAVGSNLVVGRDDTPAIKRAFARSGRAIHFPPTPGGYAMSYESKVAIQPNTYVQGSGWPSRINRVGTYARDGRMFSTILATTATEAELTHNFVMDSIHFVGNSAAAITEHTYGGQTKKQGFWDGICFLINNNHATLRIRNVRITNCVFDKVPGPALHLHNVYRSVIAKNIVNDSKRGGIIMVKDTRFCLIVNNIVDNAGDDGIAINTANDYEQPQDNIIANNYASSNTDSTMHASSAIAIRSNIGTIVIGNRVHGGKTTGIYIQEELRSPAILQSRRNIVEGNIVTGAGGPGIHALFRTAATRAVAIRNNLVQGSGTHGIELTSFVEANLIIRYATITGNIIDTPGAVTAAGTKGILVTANGTSATWRATNISDNTVTAAPEHAIYAADMNTLLQFRCQNNTIEDANTRTAAVNANCDAIFIGLANRFIVSGNTYVDNAATKKCRYFINIACLASTAIRGTYTDNVCLDTDLINTAAYFHTAAATNVTAVNNVK